LRTLGTLPAVIVVLADPLKGALATMIPTLVGVGTWGIALVGLATVLGNNFNVLLGLRGGKGIATSIGVFLVIDPLITAMCLSLGSLVGLASLPLFVLAKGNFAVPNLVLAVALTSLALVRHRDNIRRLLNGTERRLGERPRVKHKTE